MAENFYTRLTKLFRSGPALRKRIRNQDYRNFYAQEVGNTNIGYYTAASIRRESSSFSTMGGYGLIDRMARLAELAEMGFTPIVSTALDVYSDETFAPDEKNKAFHVYSKNPQIQRRLEELFYEIVDVEANGRMLTRNMIQFGDYFAYIEVVPRFGVIQFQPIAVDKVDREEGFDPKDPYAVRYKLLSYGGKYLENWQMLHFRILGTDLGLPFGISPLDACRRTWRMHQMLEDNMLLYRISRSAEKRVFYIDTTNVDSNDIGTMMETIKETIKGKSYIDKQTGREDWRFNPPDVLEDIFLPVRANDRTKVESLPGGQHVSAIEDVEYMLKKLIAGLKIPRPYLTYDEGLGGKSSLSQLDIRFSRTIATYQRILLAEFEKLAMIHLFACGFDGEDLVNFEIRLSNPSTIAVQQKLMLTSTRIELAAKALELTKETGLIDFETIQKDMLGYSDEKIASIQKGAMKDQAWLALLKGIVASNPAPDTTADNVKDSLDGATYDVPGTGNAQQPQQGDNRQTSQGLINQITKPVNSNPDGLIGFAKTQLGGQQNTPVSVSATPNLDRLTKRMARRTNGTGARDTGFHDYENMLSPKNKYFADVFGAKTDTSDIKNVFFENKDEERTERNRDLTGYVVKKPVVTSKLMKTLVEMKLHFTKTMDPSEELDIMVEMTEGKTMNGRYSVSGDNDDEEQELDLMELEPFNDDEEV